MGSVGKESLDGPLRILIVGAGNARPAGRLFERSELAKEAGAALHLASNCHGILRRFGIYPETFGANPVHGIWVLSHRVRLHEALKGAATAKEGEGPPAVLKTSSRVVDVDAVKGTVTLEDGTKFSGDLVIGADGVGFVTRKYIAPNLRPFSSGKSAFRFMVPHETTLANPLTKDDQHTTKETLLDIFSDFGPKVQALLGMADENSLKAWTLLDMKKIPRWVEGKLALLGDAAHPFLPCQYKFIR
ncbi:hypothetical protein QBC44DRAFT_340696 [Cladorrhinum sp. PSN332]|nr:hypothetical protein QBC44DRAFT_340696 [Cladorrhinum sp. PSN332]